MKTFSCYVCKERKTADGFFADRTRPTGLCSCCKDCTKNNGLRKGMVRDSLRRYQKDPANKEKIEARKKMKEAIASGVLKRQPCVICGSEDTDGHHEDYSKPLDIMWLCRTHHAQHHYGAPHWKLRFRELAESLKIDDFKVEPAIEFIEKVESEAYESGRNDQYELSKE